MIRIIGDEKKISYVQPDREVKHTSCHLTQKTLTSKHRLTDQTPRLSGGSVAARIFVDAGIHRRGECDRH